MDVGRHDIVFNPPHNTKFCFIYKKKKPAKLHFKISPKRKIERVTDSQKGVPLPLEGETTPLSPTV